MIGTNNRVVPTVGTAPTPSLFGIYQASVVSTNDPLNQKRVQLLIPQVLGTAVSNWASPLGSSVTFATVVVGQICYAAFIGGDRNYPVYLPLSWPQSANLSLSGTLAVGGLSTFTGGIKIPTGAAQNSILVSDASGNMTQKLPAGNILTTYCGPATYSGTTVTSNATTTIASMPVPANDPIAGAIYELEVNGNGVWANPAITLEFLVLYGGQSMTNITMGTVYYPAGQNFRWKMRTRVYCHSTGPSGVWTSELDGVSSAFGVNVAPSNSGGGTAGLISCESTGTFTVDTTTAQTLALQVNWGGTGGSITSQVIIPKRLA